MTSELRVAVLNDMHFNVKGEQAAAGWVTEAISDPGVSMDAVKTVVTERFGERAVAYDPSDPEACKRLAGQDRTVVPGGALPGSAWSNVRRAEALPAAGKVSPTPRPFNENGAPLGLLNDSDFNVVLDEEAPTNLSRHAGLRRYYLDGAA